MRKNKYQIGIDPDNNKSGIALWNRNQQKFEMITSLDFWELIIFITRGKYKGTSVVDYDPMDATVIIEAGWLNEKSNFHKMQGPKVREKVAKNVGMNQQIGKLIEDFCMKNNIDYEIRKPIGSKNVDAKFFRQMTGWKGVTNQDSRDAAMLVFKS